MKGKAKKILALILVLALMAGCLAACGKDSSQTEPTDPAQEQEPEASDNAAEDALSTDDLDAIADSAAGLLPSHGSTEGKEETVYVIADANGQPQRTIVSAWLKNPDEADTLIDRTDLTGIQNVKGDETYAVNDEGDLVWDARGNDIYYQGDSDRELPLSVQVSYKLDGKEVPPEELAGASGHLEMTFSYENRTSRQETIGGKDVTIYQPFVVVSCLVLDSSKASAVEVTNGTMINSGEQVIVAGVAMPGLKESLGLDSLEDADGEQIDAEVPETVTISADVNDFSLLTTVTLVENGLLNDVDLEGADSLDDLEDSVDSLVSASAKLVNGADTLYNGTQSLSGGADQLAAGATTLAAGINSLQAQMAAMLENIGKLKAGADRFASVINGDAASSLTAAQAELNNNAAAAGEALTALESGLGSLSAALTKVLGEVTNLDMDTAIAPAAEALERIGTIAADIGTQQAAADNSLNIASSSILAAITASTTLSDEEKANLSEVVTSSLGSVDSALAGINVSSIEGDIGTVQQTMGGIKDTISGKIGEIQTEISGIEQGIGSAAGLLTGLSEKLTPLAESLTSLERLNLADSFGQITGGINQLYDGVNTSLTDSKQVPALVAGAGSLKDGAVKLANGIGELEGGASTLLNGMYKFNGDGIGALSRLFKEDAQGMMDRLQALQDYGKDYSSFSGLADNMPGMVRFIIRTGSIGE